MSSLLETRRQIVRDSLSIGHALQKRAHDTPEDEVFVYLNDDGDEVARISVVQLHNRSVEVASLLIEVCIFRSVLPPTYFSNLAL
jgi:acyl-CoA synthetase (AMP-forming)/AMP-acid ligase II